MGTHIGVGEICRIFLTQCAYGHKLFTLLLHAKYIHPHSRTSKCLIQNYDMRLKSRISSLLYQVQIWLELLGYSSCFLIQTPIR